jgi:hypothetical protein
LANAWHHRSDAISSVVVLIGIAAVLTGYVYADAIAAVIVGIMIAKIGVSLVLESVRELVDTSLPDDQVAKIRNQIAGTDGVKAIHLIRTRKMGEDAYVDLHIQVDSHISVSEGHMIADSVRDNLRHNFEDIADVLVHTDPEDDEFKPETTLPPSRAIILKNLSNLWGGFYEQVREVNIHYLDGHVELEIILPLILATQHNQQELIADKCREVEQTMAIVSKTTVLFSV